MDISFERVNELFRYDPVSGYLFWRKNKGNVKAGSRAGSLGSFGYWKVKIDRKQYAAHRLIWFLFYGQHPIDEIDHINGIKTDNRIVNLRSVTGQQNSRNKKRPVSNTSGVMGVTWHRQAQRWQAVIHVDGKNKYLGLFENLEDAAQARHLAEIEHNYHQNHGRDF